MDPSEQPTKRARAESPRPPAIIQSEAELYDLRLKASSRNNPDIQPREAELNYIRVASQSAARSDVAKKIVNEIRAKLTSMTRGPGAQDCSVCFTLSGTNVMGHRSGNECPSFLCGEKDTVWKKFKDSLVFDKGRLCFNCLLLTVSVPVAHPSTTLH